MLNKILLVTFVLGVMNISCGDSSSNKLDKQEEKAVQTQVEKDQQAMDSLEKAIQAQINEVDSVSK